MPYNQLIDRKLQEQALKERMVIDCILILGTVEYVQRQIDQKLLEIDEATNNNNDDALLVLRREVLTLLAKLRREEKRMDEYMVKYRRLVDEKETLLSCVVKKRPIYLRGLPPNTIGKTKS